jgi:sugar phosphate isomerase/epimerase
VTLVGLGSDERFDSPDAAKLGKAIETTRRFLKLSHDLGASGVKVKPDSFHEGVPREKTIEQIGRSLQDLGPYAAELGQEIRLEVHGQCSDLGIIEQIVEVADHPAVAICWNCNEQDLKDDGIEANFAKVKNRLGRTVHVRAFDRSEYPYGKLIELLHDCDYDGWVLLEARGEIPADRAAGIAAQRVLFEKLVAAVEVRDER